jgi:hypothetical protein
MAFGSILLKPILFCGLHNAETIRFFSSAKTLSEKVTICQIFTYIPEVPLHFKGNFCNFAINAVKWFQALQHVQIIVRSITGDWCSEPCLKIQGDGRSFSELAVL